MELAAFFSVPEQAHRALEVLRRSGYNIDSAMIRTGDHARQSFDRSVASEKWGRALSGALTAAAVALFLAGFFMPPAPARIPWLVVGAFVLTSGVLGGTIGRFYRFDFNTDTAMLELMVPKDHINDAVDVLRIAGGQFVTFRATPNTSLRPAIGSPPTN